MRIDSSAPTRIDLAGGTYDIWPLYLWHDRAQTLNAALSLRAYCSISSRRDFRLSLTSEDTGESLEVADAADLPADRLELVVRLARFFGVRGVDIRTRSDSPIGAGIAGSSALNIAVIGALSAWTGRGLSDEELLTIAMNVEAQVIRVPTGAQDYRPALYGGLSAVELGVGGVKRIGLSVDLDDLSSRLVLAYTGASRASGINNWDVMVRRVNAEALVRDAFDLIANAANIMRDALESADWPTVALAMNQEWKARKSLAPGVTTPAIDGLLAAARDAGARAGKVCGAGGGGCLVCLVEPADRERVAAALAAQGASVLPFSIEPTGLRVSRA